MTSVSSFPAWLFFIGVILLQFGFVIREVGAVRIKDTKRIIIRHFVNLFISVVINSTCGFLFTYGDGVGDKFIGTNVANPIQFLVFTIGFQWMIAYIASAIVSGAVAERCKYIAHFISTVFITGFIHPVVRHWTLKGKGWLDYPYIGYQDSAGSGAVHVVGGIAALVGAMVIGPRTGRFEPSLKKDFTDRCNSARIAALGGIILMIGFMGFILGCRYQYFYDYSGVDSVVVLANPFLSGLIAALTSLFINRYFENKWSLFVAINGALTGMVAISAGSYDFEPYGAAIIGLIAAILYRTYSALLVRIGIDDPLDVVAVHFGGGSWGLIAVAFFHWRKGILYAWNIQSAFILSWQFIGLVAIALWTAVLSGLMFGMLKCLGVLRVPEEVQEAGLSNPANELKDIENENLQLVDITVNVSSEKICQKDTN